MLFVVTLSPMNHGRFPHFPNLKENLGDTPILHFFHFHDGDPKIMVYETIPIFSGAVFHPLYSYITNSTNQGPFFGRVRVVV